MIAFPHRDGGSVVAHGLGMSINGQDPRSNVYLLDGTLQNDFTNGPAGSAAGTALGLDTIREFRVEANAYSAEFGRNSGGQINVLTKSGTNRFAGSAFEFHRNEALDARNFFDVGGKPDFHRNQFGGTLGGPIAPTRLFFFFGYEALSERLGRTISHGRPRRQRAPRHPAERAPSTIDPAAWRRISRSSRARTGRRSARGSPSSTFPFNQKLDEHFVQGRVDYNLDQPEPVLRALHDRRHRASSCRPTIRSSRASSSRGTSSSPANTATCFSRPHAEHGAPRLQPDAHRPERRGEHDRSR